MEKLQASTLHSIASVADLSRAVGASPTPRPRSHDPKTLFLTLTLTLTEVNATILADRGLITNSSDRLRFQEKLGEVILTLTLKQPSEPIMGWL